MRQEANAYSLGPGFTRKIWQKANLSLDGPSRGEQELSYSIANIVRITVLLGQHHFVCRSVDCGVFAVARRASRRF
jgi:hypothetical protein